MRVDQARMLKDQALKMLKELKTRRSEVELMEEEADTKTRTAQAETKREYVSMAVSSLFEDVGMQQKRGKYVEQSDDVELSLISATTTDKLSNRFSDDNILNATYVHALFSPTIRLGKVRRKRGTVGLRKVVSYRTRTRKNLL